MSALAADAAAEQFCYLTTIGRKSGEPREIEIWFALDGATLLLMAGGREKAHWVRNLQADPRVAVRISGATYRGRARVLAPVEPADARARDLLVAKYAPAYSGDLSDWGRTALPVAIDIE